MREEKKLLKGLKMKQKYYDKEGKEQMEFEKEEEEKNI